MKLPIFKEKSKLVLYATLQQVK